MPQAQYHIQVSHEFLTGNLGHKHVVVVVGVVAAGLMLLLLFKGVNNVKV